MNYNRVVPMRGKRRERIDLWPSKREMRFVDVDRDDRGAVESDDKDNISKGRRYE